MKQPKKIPAVIPYDYMWSLFFNVRYIDSEVKIKVLKAYLEGHDDQEQEELLIWWKKLLADSIKSTPGVALQTLELIDYFVSSIREKDKTFTEETFRQNLPKYFPMFYKFSRADFASPDRKVLKSIFSPIGFPYDQYTSEYISETLISQGMKFSPISELKYYKKVQFWIDEELKRLSHSTKQKEVERIKLTIDSIASFLRLIEALDETGILILPRRKSGKIDEGRAAHALMQAFEITNNKGEAMSKDNVAKSFKRAIKSDHTSAIEKAKDALVNLKK
jgi:hypothetical protein